MSKQKKTTIITGATSGIGQATANLFGERGHDLILIGRDAERMGAISSKLREKGVSVRFFLLDFAVDGAVESFFRDHGVELGPVDNLVNSAGTAKLSTIGDISETDCDLLFRVNVTGAIMMTKYALPNLLQTPYPSVVNVSSVAGRQKSLSLGVHYTASKAALIGVTRHLGTELVSEGVRVNAITPSQTHSPMLDYALTSDAQKELASRNPMGRLGKPEEQAEVIWFLCSEAASYINGAIIDVNGGIL